MESIIVLIFAVVVAVLVMSQWKRVIRFLLTVFVVLAATGFFFLLIKVWPVLQVALGQI